MARFSHNSDWRADTQVYRLTRPRPTDVEKLTVWLPEAEGAAYEHHRGEHTDAESLSPRLRTIAGREIHSAVDDDTNDLDETLPRSIIGEEAHEPGGHPRNAPDGPPATAFSLASPSPTPTSPLKERRALVRRENVSPTVESELDDTGHRPNRYIAIPALLIAGITGYRRGTSLEDRSVTFRRSARRHHALFSEYRDFLGVMVPSEQVTDDEVEAEFQRLSETRRQLNRTTPDANGIWYRYIRWKSEDAIQKEISTSSETRKALSDGKSS